MERLANAAERLDGPLDDAASLAGNLRDLRRFNRLAGGTSLSLRALEHLRARTRGPLAILEVLDVGTGAADIPLAMLDHGARQGWPIRVMATVNVSCTLSIAPSRSRSRVKAAAYSEGTTSATTVLSSSIRMPSRRTSSWS